MPAAVFFSTQNQKGYKQTINEQKDTMAKEPYLSAAKSVEVDRLSLYQAWTVRFMKVGSAMGIWGLYELKMWCKVVLNVWRKRKSRV